MLRAVLPLALARSVSGDEAVRIADASGFKSFVDDVNKGTNYLGTTVYLDSDLTLPESIEHAGNYTYHFRGTFDGQGHIISNPAMDSSSPYAGLFGFSYGLTIKNVILDGSCSVENSYSGPSNVSAGGIIGECYAYSGQCNIENSVSMANVTFSGDIPNGYSLYLGGIVGWLFSSGYSGYVKNCANYGSVTHSGTSYRSYIGGIVGCIYGSKYKYLYNSLNYGTITHSGKTSFILDLGGITGRSYCTYIENCVSAGRISTQNASSDNRVGSIVGCADSETYIKYCYCTSELSGYKIYGAGTPESSSHTLSYDNTKFELSESVSIGNHTERSLVEALNAAVGHYLLRGYSNWLFNKENKSVTFTINSTASPITMSSQIILIPSLASEGRISFDGWYDDSECTNPLKSFEVTKDTALYGRLEENTNNYTITLESRREGVFVAPITAQFGAVVSLPNDLTREYCSIAFWENEYDDDVGFSLVMPARNFTLYAVWECTRIASLDDFADFSKFMNIRTTYLGTTVLLDADLPFSEKMPKPINYFCGTFDGQGHVISNLAMNSSSPYAGLFGFSYGLTIKNVVLDGSCTVENSYSGPSKVFAGGIIGECYAGSGQCNIENSVNMADVIFSGDILNGYWLYLGGIVGYSFSSGYVKNCANYGSVTHSGASYRSAIGGIVGELAGYNSTYYAYLHNSLNYGTITHSGKTSFILDLGGVTGRSNCTYIENCVSAGPISTPTTASSDNRVGSIVGCVNSETYVNDSFKTGDVGVGKLYGVGTPASTEMSSSSTTTDLTLGLVIKRLNENAPRSSDWNKWLLNENNTLVSFIVNYGAGFALGSQIILLPDLVGNSASSFSGWYDSPFCNELFLSHEPSAVKAMSLYGLYGEIISVTFDASGGSAVEKSKNVSYNSPYGDLPEAKRAGNAFLGWFTEKNERVTNETIVANPYSHTLYANWEEEVSETKEDKDSNLTLIVAVTVPIVAIVVVIVIIVVFLTILKRNGRINDNEDIKLDDYPREDYCRIVTPTAEENETEVASGSSQSILSNLYSQGYTRPLIRDALLEAGLAKEQIDYICCACENVSQKAPMDGNPIEITKDDAAAIAMYTYDFGPCDFESNPYRIINRSLVGRNYNSLQKASGLLYLVMCALRKLPRYTGKTLYRGVRGDVNLDEDHYHKGNTIVWSALSSTSPSIEATKAFLAKGSKSGKAVGTLFIIENGWGYNIQPYSLFPEEVEILLEPDRQFKVTGVIRADLTIVNLQMLDTPLSIPEVFGG